MAKGRKRMVNPCTCGCAKKDHWRGEGWCGQCGCTWWHPRNPKAYAAKLERERKKRIKTVGDAIREHMAVVAEGGDGTEEWREFLGLPGEGRFNGAGMIYAAALQMLNAAVETVEGLMMEVVIHTTRPADQPENPERDKAVIRGWEFLRQFGRMPEIVKIEIGEPEE